MSSLRKIVVIALLVPLITGCTKMNLPHKNRLANAKSPYLRLHQDNPIDWYEWGEEAFEKARRENKPLFISIGYFSCHWCHVMNEETFSDREVGEVLNKNFVAIKVDRQEHPDVDARYIEFLQVTTGGAGWPANIFATPDGTPIFGATFLPPRPGKYGMGAGLIEIATKVAQFYESSKGKIEQSRLALDEISKKLRLKHADEKEAQGQLQNAVGKIRAGFDKEKGGFGEGSKFPIEPLLFLLLVQDKGAGIDMVIKTLDEMAVGGIRDHVGGGFFRYTVDNQWRIPHFEKMIYDNAPLVRLYLSLYRITGKARYLDIAKETGEYMLRELYSKGGGFWPSQNADSDGKEGAFYIFTLDEVIKLLGEKDGTLLADYLGITKQGNFENGTSVPYLPNGYDEKRDDNLSSAMHKLFEYRNKRIKPATEKVLISGWSAMGARAMIDLYGVTGEKRYLDAGRETLHFVTRGAKNVSIPHSDLGSAPGFLDDYSETIMAYIDLFDLTQKREHIDKAIKLVDEALELFEDKNEGGFYYSAQAQNGLMKRSKIYTESATVSGYMQFSDALIRLFSHTGKMNYYDIAEKALYSAGVANQTIMGVPTYAKAMWLLKNGYQDFVLAGNGNKKETETVLNKITALPNPAKTVLLRTPDSSFDPAMHKDKIAVGGKPTLYLCRNFTCSAPAVGLPAIEDLLSRESKTYENFVAE